VTKRAQLTPAQITEMRDLCLDGMGIRELAARFNRSSTTVSNYTADLRARPEMPPLEVAPDNPNADRWWHRAACRDTDVNTFYPGDDDGPGIEFAQRICGACPLEVRSACLQEALEAGLQGIWGGTTDRQRHKMSARARRGAAA
jgi:WhiB family redox-sensing transcriptional regulator